MKTEGPERDPTWVQSLPNEAQRCFCKHALEIASGLYDPEITGALSAITVDKYSVELFQKGARVSVRFTTPFRIAYDSLVGVRFAVSVDEDAGPGGYSAESAGSNAAASAGSQQEGHAEKNTHDSKVTNLSVFRNQCEQYCARELEARMVTLLAEGSHAEIKASVTTTRLYKNLTEDVPLMAFYDVKNAKLCNIYEGEGVLMFTVFCVERPF